MLIWDLLIGVAVLNASAALVAAVWIFISTRLAVLLVVFGAFGLFALSVSRPRLATLFLFFFILAGYESIVLEEYLTAALGGYETDVRVADATEHEAAAVFQFADGRLLPEMYGVSSMTSKAGDSRVGASYSFVAPVVSDGWTKNDPVTVWATCSRTDAGVTGQVRIPVSACGDFGTRYNTAVAVPESGFFRAVEDAEKRHGLTAHPDALLAAFVESPARYIHEKRRWAVRLPLLFNALFVVAILVTAFLQRKRPRAAPGSNGAESVPPNK